ncbi:MAG: hypothetical protein ABI621_13370, partial [Chloroflexota bacterium]
CISTDERGGTRLIFSVIFLLSFGSCHCGRSLRSNLLMRGIRNKSGSASSLISLQPGRIFGVLDQHIIATTLIVLDFCQ